MKNLVVLQILFFPGPSLLITLRHYRTKINDLLPPPARLLFTERHDPSVGDTFLSFHCRCTFYDFPKQVLSCLFTYFLPNQSAVNLRAHRDKPVSSQWLWSRTFISASAAPKSFDKFARSLVDEQAIGFLLYRSVINIFSCIPSENPLRSSWLHILAHHRAKLPPEPHHGLSYRFCTTRLPSILRLSIRNIANQWTYISGDIWIVGIHCCIAK